MKQNDVTNKTEFQNNKNQISANYSELYAGPIPHPDILAKFGDVDKSFPNRIMVMAEKHAEANIRTQNKNANENLIGSILGQILTFLIALSGLLLGTFLSIKGIEAGGIASIITGFSPILISAITNIRKK